MSLIYCVPHTDTPVLALAFLPPYAYYSSRLLSEGFIGPAMKKGQRWVIATTILNSLDAAITLLRTFAIQCFQKLLTLIFRQAWTATSSPKAVSDPR